jgi:hypothetical protein
MVVPQRPAFKMETAQISVLQEAVVQPLHVQKQMESTSVQAANKTRCSPSFLIHITVDFGWDNFRQAIVNIVFLILVLVVVGEPTSYLKVRPFSRVLGTSYFASFLVDYRVCAIPYQSAFRNERRIELLSQH